MIVMSLRRYELKLCSRRLIVGTVYRPPDQANFYELISPVLEKIWATRSNILITGDLNSDLTPDHENDKGRKLSIILKKWRSQIDRGYVVRIIFINFQKAFDTVSHDVLFHKLLAAGISGNSHEWIVDYLSNRVQYTEVNGKASTVKAVKEVKYIVLQGSLLGPRLYSIQVNDLPDCIEEGELSLFADDTNVCCIGHNVEEVVDMLNKVMAQVYDWCMKNKLTVHPGKKQ